MKVTGVRVEVTKRLSDGNYGFEQCNAQYIAELDEGDDPDEMIRQLAARGREKVVGELKESESTSIRWALEPPKRAASTVCADCSKELGAEWAVVPTAAGEAVTVCMDCDRKREDAEADIAMDDLPF